MEYLSQYDDSDHDNEDVSARNSRRTSGVGVLRPLSYDSDVAWLNTPRSSESRRGISEPDVGVEVLESRSRPSSVQLFGQTDSGLQDDTNQSRRPSGISEISFRSPFPFLPDATPLERVHLPADNSYVPGPTWQNRAPPDDFGIQVSEILAQITLNPPAYSGTRGGIELPHIDTELPTDIGQLGQETSFVTARAIFDSPASMAPSEIQRAPTSTPAMPVEQETQTTGSRLPPQPPATEESLGFFPDWERTSRPGYVPVNAGDSKLAFSSGQYVDNMHHVVYPSEGDHRFTQFTRHGRETQNSEHAAINPESAVKIYSRKNTQETQRREHPVKFQKVLKSRPNPIINAMANHSPGEHIFKPQSMLDPEHDSSFTISSQPSGIPEDSALWEDYVQEAEQQDSEKVANWNQTMDVLLVFATLFSGILTAFIIDVFKTLKPDPQVTIVGLLQNISIAVQGNPQNRTISPTSTLPGAFVPRSGYVWVNGLYFASLACSLSTAMIIILIKQWLQFYSVKLWNCNSYQYARHRQYKYNALQKWQVSTIISVLPLLLHIAVVLFAIGLVIMLLQVNSAIAYAVTGMVGSLLLTYGVGLVLPLIFDDCPYKSSASIMLGIFGNLLLVLIYSVANQMLLFLRRLTCHSQGFPSGIETSLLSSLKTSLSQLKSMPESSGLTSVNNLDNATLDQDSLIWLASISQNKAAVENSLVAIKYLAPTSDMIDKIMETNILAELAKKAYVPLPARSDVFWKKDLLLDSHKIAPAHDIEEAALYMKSLLRAWNHSAYLDLYLPPAISEESRHATHTWLLHDWILLWRRLRQQSDIETIVRNGWNFEIFALIICVEVMFYQIHVQPKSIPILQQISLSFNLEEPNTLHDLYDVIQHYHTEDINASEELICSMLVVLKRVLVTADLLQQSDFKHRTLLLLLKCWDYHDAHAQKAACYQIIICIKLLITSNAEERRVLVVNESSASPAMFLQVFTAIIKDKLAGNVLQLLEKHEDTQILLLTATQVYKILCAKPDLGDRYSKVIFTLPMVIADELAQLFARRVSYHWKENTELFWFVDFMIQWSSKGNLSIHGHMNLGFCLWDVVEFLSNRKDHVAHDAAHPLRHKILSFLMQFEHEYAEGRVSILHGILDNALTNRNDATITQFLSMQGPSKVCTYINSASVATAIAEKWKQFYWHLKIQLIWLGQPPQDGYAEWHNLLEQLHNQLASILKPATEPSDSEPTETVPNPLVDTTDNSLTSHMGNLSVVSFSSDGRLMASCSWNATIYIWDVASETLLGRLSMDAQDVSAVSFSQSGKYIASGSEDKSICIWEVERQELVTTRSTIHADAIISLAFSPNEEYILSSSWDQTLCVWKIASGEIFWKHSVTNIVTSVAFSMDAELVSSGSIDGHIYMWNGRTGAAITGGHVVPKLSGHLDTITAVVFVDNKHLISSSWDDTLHIWDLSTGTSSRWTNGGRIASSNGALDEQDTTPFAVSADNSLMASALWKDVILSKVLSSDDTKLEHYNLSAHKKEVTAVAFSPNQDFIVSGSKDTTVRIWNVSDQTQILDAMFGHSDEISSVAYSYNNKLVASGSKDKTVCIWNAETGSLVKKLHGDSTVLAISFSPSGEYVVTGFSNNSIHIWDINAADITFKLLHGHSAPVISVTFSTDGKFVMSGASDHVVCIWDATTGVCVKKLVNILHASS